jgi:hypothetical protein
MVNTTNSDDNSSDTTDQGGEMVRNYKNEGSTARMNKTGRSPKIDYMRFKTTQKNRSTNKNMNKYPQVRKTGGDAVHGSCRQMV